MNPQPYHPPVTEDVPEVNFEYCWYKEADLDVALLAKYQLDVDRAADDGNLAADNGCLMPETVQEKLQSSFEHQKSALTDQITNMKAEIENMQKAFDLYRERARTSLLKTASDQQGIQTKYSQLQEEIKVSDCLQMTSDCLIRYRRRNRSITTSSCNTLIWKNSSMSSRKE